MSPLTLIDLAKGEPSPDLLPNAILSKAASRALSNKEIFSRALSYGEDPGYRALREAIALWLSQSFSSSKWLKAESISITAGASQNLACILQCFSDPSYTKHIYMVSPTYHLACRVFEDNGFTGRMRAVPEDAEGLDAATLETLLSRDEVINGWYEDRTAKRADTSQKRYKNILYCVPTFSNPSGKTMSLARREQLVRLARKYDVLIIADDVYNFLNWSSSATLPSLVDIDHELDGGPVTPWGNAVSNSSFSKIIAPGMRTGWTVAMPRFIQGIAQCGTIISGGPSSGLLAAMITEALNNGSLQDHIHSSLIPTYQRRSCLALSAIKRYLVPCGVVIDTEVQGGYFMFLYLPQPVRAADFAVAARQWEQVLVESSHKFAVCGDNEDVLCRNGFRMCFAWEDEHQIEEGIQRLSRVLKHLLNNVRNVGD